MTEHDSILNYSIPVHRALMEPDVFLGIGIMPAYIIFTITILLATMVSLWCISVGIIAFAICKVISKDDPYLLQFVVENLNLADTYWG